MSTSLRVLENRDAISASRYRVIARLGRGGMAEVFLAIQSGITGFRRLSVVKRLRSDFNEEDFLEMFQAEARLAVRLNHPNVVHTYEVGHDGEFHFISMEYLRGHSYLKLLKRVGRDKLDFAYSVRILIDALKGLEYAHQLVDFDGTPLNIVHRDCSPSNVFITYDGRIKILDFGIAKALGSSVDTGSGVLKGKLAYMSPEQAAGKDTDAQADLYAIGVLLWEAAAQRKRWEGIQDAAIMKQLIANEPPVAPDAMKAGLPIDVDALCLQALAPDPKDRFANAAEFRQELENLLEKMGKRVTAEDVGKLTEEHFTEDAARLQTVIETKMKEYDAGDDLTIDNLTSLKQGASKDSGPPLDQESGIKTVLAPFPSEAPWYRQPKLVGVAGVAALGLVVGALAWSSSTPEETAADASAAPAPPAQVSLRIEAKPATAKILWDDRALETNPYVTEVRRSKKTIRLRAEAEGYVPQSAILSLDADRNVTFELEPVPVVTQEVPADTEAEPEPSAKPATSRRWKAKPRLKLDTSNPWED